MKKLAFTISIILLMGLSMHSCEKEKVAKNDNLSSSLSIEKEGIKAERDKVACKDYETFTEKHNGKYCSKRGVGCLPCVTIAAPSTQNINEIIKFLLQGPDNISHFFSDSRNFEELFPALLHENNNHYLSELRSGNSVLTKVIQDEELSRILLLFFNEKNNSEFALIYAEE